MTREIITFDKDFRKLNDMATLESDQDWENHVNYFSRNNVIVNAKVKKIDYKEHWSPLSIKCAFGGIENYHNKNFFYSVDDSNFLVFNEGSEYASFINSATEVESFTIHFSPFFERASSLSLCATDAKLLDDPFFIHDSGIRFSQKLLPHDQQVSPILMKLRELSLDFDFNKSEIAEQYYFLYCALVKSQTSLNKEILKVDALRLSTKKELFKRLNIAYDYILSRYKYNVTLEEIAEITCLNQYYLLRQFKKYFGITPHQFLLKLRFNEAFKLLTETNKSATDICSELGFGDLAAFSKAFKKKFSVSPQNFKANL